MSERQQMVCSLAVARRGWRSVGVVRRSWSKKIDHRGHEDISTKKIFYRSVSRLHKQEIPLKKEYDCKFLPIFWRESAGCRVGDAVPMNWALQKIGWPEFFHGNVHHKFTVCNIIKRWFILKNWILILRIHNILKNHVTVTESK